MNRDNLSALAVGIAVVALIAGFGIYFNSPSLNATAGGTGGKFVTAVSDNGTRVAIDKSQFRQAPELAGISNYINTGEFKLADLKGKVVLVDFWTYSCINCIRTIPYLNAWYEKYADDGLVIVGVHAPEFDFEKNPENVQAALEKFGIKYPVVQDNEHGTWDAYQNRYWPRKYLVDDEGYIRYDHIGEGSYGETEKVIKSLLQERAANLGRAIAIDGSVVKPDAQSVDFGQINTPELYFGYDYARAPLGNLEGFKPEQTVTYSIADDQKFEPSTIYVSGKWENKPAYMELKSGVGRIVLEYSAKSVNIVAGGSATVHVSVDGRSPNAKGSDVGEDGSFAVDGQRLYNVASHKTYGDHRLVMDVMGEEEFQIYTFTFG
jgi:thiol-disulfide isomerase/thioredoxin